jgi:ribonucleotide reductase beta subunit family protein with ferritin-like domain
MTRWSTLVVDEAGVNRLGQMESSVLCGHADMVAARDFKPRDLVRRWETQQWNSQEISFERDAEDYQRRIPRRIRGDVEKLIATFIVGEYTGVDLLSPVMLGAANEEDVMFLATQAADETRHAQLMFRIGREVLGYDDDPHAMLRQAWNKAEDEHRQIALIEGEIMRDIVAKPTDYTRWIRGIAMFHLVTEGVMALAGQRTAIRVLGHLNLLTGIRSSFAALCRDESRHIGFGVHSLKVGIREGQREAIYDVLERTLPMALAMTNESYPGTGTADIQRNAMVKIFRNVGVDTVFQDHIEHLTSKYLAEKAKGIPA